jgi:hypothetical protein
MPIPTPKSSENKTAFVSRCKSQISGEYPNDQALAICISKWDNEKFASYPWAKCIEDQQARGYSIKTSERICGWIKKQNQ